MMNGGAKLAPELRRRVELRFGCTFQESFGTGEGLLNMTRLDDPAEIRFTSSGRPISPADEIRIVDEQGKDVADGEVGELICRGPYTVRGYYNAPEKNRAAFTSRRLSTGWATWCAGLAAISIVEGRLQGHHQSRRRKDQLRGSRKSIFWAIPRSRMSAWWRCPTRCSAKRPAPS